MRGSGARRRDGARRGRRKLLAAALLLALPVIVVLEAVWAVSRPRLPSDPGFDVAATVGDERPGTPVDLHVVGDSTVAGVGVDDEAASLAVRVAERTSKLLGRPVRVRGHGETGARTRDAIEQLDAVPAGVDAIVIEIGSNDVTHLTSLDEVEAATRALLQAALRRSDVIVLGSAGKLDTPNFLQPLRALVVARATAVRARQEQVARELDVPFVDVALEVAPAFHRIGPDANSSDGFHPSARGYDAWSRPLARRLATALRPIA